MNIIVNSDRTVEKEYTEKDGSQNENRVTELNFTLPEEYSGEGFVPKIAFITEDGNFSDYIDNGKYILKNNITKYREVICFVWLTNSVNNIDFRSQTFPLEFYYNEDPSDYIPSEQEKSQIELLMEELDEKIQEVTELEENVYTKDETYSKSETYSKEETYNKQEIDSKVSSVYKYKGTVATYNNLPSTGLTIGDAYNVEDTGDNYAWTGTDWDKLGGNIDLSGYQEKIDNSHKLNADLVDDTNSTNKFTNTTEKNSWNAKYTKPSGGIPKADLSEEVKASLNKADSAIQDISGKEDNSNKVTSIDENSTEDEYPNAEAVYNELVKRDEEISSLKSKNAQLIADHPDIEETGTDLSLEGTGDLPMEVDVGGNSTQKQYEGYNKFILPNEATIAGVKLTKNKDGSITLNGTANQSENFFVENKTLQAGNYTLQCKYEGILPTGGNARCQIYSPNTSLVASIPNDAENNRVNNATLSTDLTDIQFRIRVEGGFTYNNVTLYPLLVQGTYTSQTMPEFEPYVGGTASPNPTYEQDINNVEGDVVVKGKSKNLLDYPSDFTEEKNGVTVIGNKGVYKINGTSSANTTFTTREIQNYTIQEGDYLHLLNDKLNNNFAFVLKFTDNSVASISLSNLKRIFDLSSSVGKTISGIYFYTNSGYTNDNITFSPMILNTNTATPYVPHQENTVTFPLAQGQKLMLGDTLEDDGIHHKRGQYLFTGNETIGKSGYSNEDYFCGYYNTVEEIVSGRILCNILGYAQYIISPIKEGIWAQNNHSINFSIEASRLTENSAEGVKAYLTQLYNNGTPMVIEYELNEETIDPYTTEQQTAYNKLKEMQSYYDLTYVTGSSDNVQPILTAKAKKSLKVMQNEIDNINSRLALLE